MSEHTPTELAGIAKRWEADAYTVPLHVGWMAEQAWKDAVALANAYLAHIAATEAEAAERAKLIDEAWLCSLGFREERGWDGLKRGPLRRIKQREDMVWWGYNQQIFAQGPVTRGQLLDLMSALGITNLV